eukprot:4462691-Amphidinium_carterae.1
MDGIGATHAPVLKNLRCRPVFSACFPREFGCVPEESHESSSSHVGSRCGGHSVIMNYTATAVAAAGAVVQGCDVQ